MRIPSFTRIITEDFSKEVQKWIPKLADPLNNFMLTMKNGLNKGITINENMSGEVKTILVTGGTVSFSYESSRQPKAVMLGNWVNLDDSAWAPTAGIGLKWSYGERVVTCTFYGLDATDKYNITLVIFDD